MVAADAMSANPAVETPDVRRAAISEERATRNTAQNGPAKAREQGP